MQSGRGISSIIHHIYRTIIILWYYTLIALSFNIFLSPSENPLKNALMHLITCHIILPTCWSHPLPRTISLLFSLVSYIFLIHSPALEFSIFLFRTSRLFLIQLLAIINFSLQSCNFQCHASLLFSSAIFLLIFIPLQSMALQSSFMCLFFKHDLIQRFTEYHDFFFICWVSFRFLFLSWNITFLKQMSGIFSYGLIVCPITW
jgi:hypothetical protein